MISFIIYIFFNCDMWTLYILCEKGYCNFKSAV